MKRLISFWEKQAWVEKLGERAKPRLDKLMEKTGNKQRTADFLNGVWLGHPLHPMLVSLPIGAWTSAAVFDTVALLSGGKSKAANGMIAFGMASAVPSAAAGAADWKHLNGSKSRLGAGHALMNSAALACYGVSLLARRSGYSGRLSALLGLGLVSASGYIGGHLVYSELVGVKHTPDAEAPEAFEAAGRASEIGDGTLHRVEVEGVPVLLARVDGRMYAVSDVCTHLGCSLADGGTLEGEEVVCPCHSSRFSVVDGRVTAGPATMPLATYDLRVVDGEVEIREQVPSS